MSTFNALFTPAEFEAFHASAHEGHVCVVFDILRATSSMVTALHHGAAGILPAASIAEALRLHEAHPGSLLAGEREGLRIRSSVSGTVDFDLGNSPREFTPPGVAGRLIVMTTTNGTRALRACADSRAVLVCSFLNLQSTAEYLLRMDPQNLVLVCGGTGEWAAYEDVLCAGALAELLWPERSEGQVSDAILLARRLYQLEARDLHAAFAQSSNGRRLLAMPELAGDVAFCAEKSQFHLVAGLMGDRIVPIS